MPEWRTIPGYPGYSVSDAGLIRGERRPYAGRILRLQLTRKGYQSITASLPTGRKNLKVHHAVLLAFVGPRPDGYEGRHLNDDKLDNRVANLAWGTPMENVEDRARNGRVARGIRPANARFTDDQVRLIRHLRDTESLSQRQLGAMFGVCHQTIGKILRDERYIEQSEAAPAPGEVRGDG